MTKSYEIVMTLQAIANHTGLTVPQITYRLKLHEQELTNDVNRDDV